MTWKPTLPGLFDAPTTATDPGLNAYRSAFTTYSRGLSILIWVLLHGKSMCILDDARTPPDRISIDSRRGAAHHFGKVVRPYTIYGITSGPMRGGRVFSPSRGGEIGTGHGEGYRRDLPEVRERQDPHDGHRPRGAGAVRLCVARSHGADRTRGQHAPGGSRKPGDVLFVPVRETPRPGRHPALQRHRGLDEGVRGRRRRDVQGARR